MTPAAICLLASQIAKGGTGMTALAGQMLNLVLEDLVLIRNLKVNRVTQLLAVTPAVGYGPFTLEADYKRTYDLFYPLPTSGGAQTSGGLTMKLTPITMEQFDMEFKDPSTANYPYEFATDLSTQAQVWDGGVGNTTPGLFTGIGTKTSAGFLYIYPQTSGNLTLTHRYMKNQPTITAPETNTTGSPWFEYTDYLIEATAGRMMGITGDDRGKEFRDRALEMLRPYLIEEGDEQQAVHHIKLDPRHFRSARSLKNTKASPM